MIRRRDHMQQHTAQHLLSAVCKRDYKATTVSWNMSKYPEPSFVELDIPSLSIEDLESISNTVNKYITDNTKVRVRVFASADEAVLDPDYAAALEVGRAKAFPTGLVGPARSVEIEGLEFNTCCGTHAPSLSVLQSIAILRAEKYKGNTKLYFNCGKRITAQYEEMHNRTQALIAALSAAPQLHLETVEKLQASLKSEMKKTDALSNRFAESILKDLQVQSNQRSNITESKTTDDTTVTDGEIPALPEDVNIAYYSYPYYDGVVDMKVLLAVASLFQEWVSLPEQMNGRRKVACLFAPSAEPVVDSVTKTTSCSGVFVLSGEKTAVAACGPIIAKVLNGKGGGRPGLYQGKAQNVEKCILIEKAIQ